MSILVDKEIEMQCYLPRWKIISTTIRDGVEMITGDIMVNDDQLETYRKDQPGLRTSNIAEWDIPNGRHRYELVALDEAVMIEKYRPMIVPFSNKQVRVRDPETNLEHLARVQKVLDGLPDNHHQFGWKASDIPDGTRVDGLLMPPRPEEKMISYGLSAAGYDVRLTNKFKIFTNINSAVIDPKNFDEDKCLVDFEGDVCIIPPHSYILGVTPEVFDIPNDTMVVCVGKSTYARAGCAVNVTPIEPGFRGQVVIEISNLTPLPMKVYANEGIAQFLFFKAKQNCRTPYSLNGRKYQNQRGIVLPRV